MNNPLKQLEPNSLWQHFYSITQIPHPSGHTEKIRQFLVHFGNSHRLETLTDVAGNVLIRKPATTGMEHKKTVILQAHMDMVPQKNSGVQHSFETDALSVFVDEDWVKAKDTTLGADNGIGMAAILAILESTDINHGAIEALFTNDEETGMYGVFGLKSGWLTGEILLNLDSEEEGELFVGCAGGIDADFTFSYEKAPVPEGDIALLVKVSGLQGGHSGIDIQLERANANKLLVRFLKMAVVEYEARLASVDGGSLRNAIPREAHAVITIPADGFDEFMELAVETEEMFNQEFEGIEKNINLQVVKTVMPQGILPEEVQDDFINAVYAAPNGVFRHIPHMYGVVETSNNLASIVTDEKTVKVKCLIRSSEESKKYELCSMLESLFSLAGAKVEFLGGYPGWKPNLDSEILLEMKRIYKRKWDKNPVVKVIHAGLECGIIASVEPDLDMISFGPTIRYPHSPNEKVCISSVQKFWDLLIETIKYLPSVEE